MSTLTYGKLVCILNKKNTSKNEYANMVLYKEFMQQKKNLILEYIEIHVL